MKKIISLLLVAVMVVSMFAGLQINSSALGFSGQCGTNAFWTYNSSNKELTVSGYGLIDSYSFYNTDIVSVIIKSGITDIGDCAFKSCKNLTSVSIANSVEFIRYEAFYNCSELTAFNIGDVYTGVDEFVFDSCSAKAIAVTESALKTIENEAFCGCAKLSGFNIPSGVTTIGVSAFENCSSIKSIAIPDNVTNLPNSVFEKCDNLANVSFGASLQVIGHSTFKGTAIQHLNIPAGVTAIGNNAFAYCSKLVSVNILGNLSRLGNGAFANCADLSTVSILSPISKIERETFKECCYLQSITIPASVTFIGDAAFYYCQSLTHVYYTGTKAQWGKIYIDYNNKSLLDATIHYNLYHTHDYIYTKVAPKSNALGFSYYKCSCGEAKKDSAGNIIKGNFIAPTGKPAGIKCAARTAAAQKFTWLKTLFANGYQVQLLNSSNKQVALKATTSNAYVFTNLAAGSNYKFRVRFYITAPNGKNYYGAWSALLTSPTLPATTSITKTGIAKNAFAVQWKTVGGVTGYQVQYATNSAFNSAKLVAVKGTSKSVKNLKGGVRYYVRVRTYKTIGGKNYFSTWSGAKSVTTKK